MEKFMLQSDLTKYYCPNCGRYIIWNEAIEGEYPNEQ